MNFKAMCLISILTFSFLTLTFDNVTAGTSDVTLKEGKIHMDADNGKTGFLWGYKIDTRENVLDVCFKHPHKTCVHDEYYNINTNERMNVAISILYDTRKYIVSFDDVDPVTCGFKVYGVSESPQINYDFYSKGYHYKGQYSWIQSLGYVTQM